MTIIRVRGGGGLMVENIIQKIINIQINHNFLKTFAILKVTSALRTGMMQPTKNSAFALKYCYLKKI